jgi:hypothetical protein
MTTEYVEPLRRLDPHLLQHFQHAAELEKCVGDPPRKLTINFNVNWPALIEKFGPQG